MYAQCSIEPGNSVAVPASVGTIFSLLLLLAGVFLGVVLLFYYIRLRKKRQMKSCQLDITAM